MIDLAKRLDAQDRELIALLQADARASYQELGQIVGLSPSTVRRRVERLIDMKMIKLVAVPSWMHVGLELISFISFSVELNRLRDIGNELSMMDEVVFVAMVTGDRDLFAEVVLPTNADFVRFVTTRIAPIKGIRSIQTFMVPEFIKSFEQYRFPSMPNPLYLRQNDGVYTYSDQELPTRSTPDRNGNESSELATSLSSSSDEGGLA
jgi:Lrp/AsnC family transcriptional regulator for asnA, asnC and gidA